MSAIESAEASDTFKPVRSLLEVYGRVPFFYFLHHMTLVHLLALIVTVATGGDWRWRVTEFPEGGVLAGHAPSYGYGLDVVWSIWILVVALCYPACKWYAAVKRGNRNRVLSYL